MLGVLGLWKEDFNNTECKMKSILPTDSREQPGIKGRKLGLFPQSRHVTLSSGQSCEYGEKFIRALGVVGSVSCILGKQGWIPCVGRWLGAGRQWGLTGASQPNEVQSAEGIKMVSHKKQNGERTH